MREIFMTWLRRAGRPVLVLGFAGMLACSDRRIDSIPKRRSHRSWTAW